VPRQTGEELKGVLLARRGETEVRLGHALAGGGRPKPTVGEARDGQAPGWIKPMQHVRGNVGAGSPGGKWAKMLLAAAHHARPNR
jgi:hypothetical protein